MIMTVTEHSTFMVLTITKCNEGFKCSEELFNASNPIPVVYEYSATHWWAYFSHLMPILVDSTLTVHLATFIAAPGSGRGASSRRRPSR